MCRLRLFWGSSDLGIISWWSWHLVSGDGGIVTHKIPLAVASVCDFHHNYCIYMYLTHQFPWLSAFEQIQIFPNTSVFNLSVFQSLTLTLKSPLVAAGRRVPWAQSAKGHQRLLSEPARPALPLHPHHRHQPKSRRQPKHPSCSPQASSVSL